jgi:hypothetical protein
MLLLLILVLLMILSDGSKIKIMSTIKSKSLKEKSAGQLADAEVKTPADCFLEITSPGCVL